MLVVTSFALAATTGCGGESSAGSANGGSGGAPTTQAGGAASSGGVAPGGSAGASGGTTVVGSDKDPGCIDFQVPAELDIVADGADATLRCDDSRSDVNACGGEGDLVGFDYETPELYFWINFQPAFVAAPKTEAALREYFRWFWYQIRIPAPQGGEPFTTDRIYVEDLAETDAFTFAEGRLHVVVHTSIEQMRRWIAPEGASCYDTDVGPNPCACEYAVSIPTTVDLELALPE